MELKGKWKELSGKYWPPGKDQLLILLLTGLLLAVIALPADQKEKNTEGFRSEDTEAEKTADYTAQLESRLEQLLSQVEGVGQVKVMLTFEGSSEKKVEKDRSLSEGSSQEETVYTETGGSGRIPYVASEKNPQVEGVLVIAQGGGNGRIRQEILEAAQALFGIEAHKIKIMKMEATQ